MTTDIHVATAAHMRFIDLDEGGEPFSLVEFMLANLHDEEVDGWIATLRALPVGGEWELDNGASGITRFRRIV